MFIVVKDVAGKPWRVRADDVAAFRAIGPRQTEIQVRDKTVTVMVDAREVEEILRRKFGAEFVVCGERGEKTEGASGV